MPRVNGDMEIFFKSNTVIEFKKEQERITRTFVKDIPYFMEILPSIDIRYCNLRSWEDQSIAWNIPRSWFKIEYTSPEFL